MNLKQRLISKMKECIRRIDTDIPEKLMDELDSSELIQALHRDQECKHDIKYFIDMAKQAKNN